MKIFSRKYFTDDSACDVTVIKANSEDQVKLNERLIEVLHRGLETVGKLHQLVEMLMLVSVLVPDEWIQPRGCHECGSDGLDLLEHAELGLGQQFVKVADDFVEESETFEAFLIDITLLVKLFVVGNGGEHHGYVFVSLAVQIL